MANYRNQKRWVVIVTFLSAMAVGPIIVLSETGAVPERLIDWLLIVFQSFLVLSWCYFDSLERGKRITLSTRILILLFGIFFLCFYLIKSRGLKQGFKAIGLALLVFVGAIVVTAISGGIATLILGVSLD
ncbi:MAG: hypothetical protein ACKVZH_22075 [Blastocatellia bacterium]